MESLDKKSEGKTSNEVNLRNEKKRKMAIENKKAEAQRVVKASKGIRKRAPEHIQRAAEENPLGITKIRSVEELEELVLELQESLKRHREVIRELESSRIDLQERLDNSQDHVEVLEKCIDNAGVKIQSEKLSLTQIRATKYKILDAHGFSEEEFEKKALEHDLDGVEYADWLMFKNLRSAEARITKKYSERNDNA